MTVSDAAAESGAGALPAECQKAIDALGHNEADNFRLEAEDGARRHIERLEPLRIKTQPLVNVLRSAPVQQAIAGYLDFDKQAVSARRKYERQRMVMLAPIAVALAVCLFSFIAPERQIAIWLAGGGGEQNAALVESIRLWLLQISTWLVFGLLILTAALAIFLEPGPSYSRWMEARGEAEGMRRKMFERVIEAPAQAIVGAVEPLLLKLEYFRRYQLEIQQAYFHRKCREHRARLSSARTLQIACIALLAVWGLLIIGAVAAGKSEQGAVTLPLLGSRFGLQASGLVQSVERFGIDVSAIAAATLLALVYVGVLYVGHLGKSARNSTRFDIMGENLDELFKDLDKVRRAAAQGDTAAVRSFVERVHSVLSVENADWIRLQALDKAQRRGQDMLSASTSAGTAV